MKDRSFHFNSIAAYENQHIAIRNLGNSYYQKGSRLFKTEGFNPTIEFRKALILAIYWYGKACEWLMNLAEKNYPDGAFNDTNIVSKEI